MYLGESYDDWVLSIERSGDAVHLVVYDFFNPSDRHEYEGTIAGDALSVPAKSFSSVGYCSQSGQIEFTGQNEVAGHFSENGTALIASEDTSLRLTSGESITLHYDWVARLSK